MDRTLCSACGAQIDTLDMSDERAPCSICGATMRTIEVSLVSTVVVRDGFGVKAKRPGQKKPFVEELSVPSFSFGRQKIVHRQRVIDRDDDHYSERVVDYETGEVIHACDEPLSSHVGHGCARKKCGTGDG